MALRGGGGDLCEEPEKRQRYANINDLRVVEYGRRSSVPVGAPLGGGRGGSKKKLELFLSANEKKMLRRSTAFIEWEKRRLYRNCIYGVNDEKLYPPTLSISVSSSSFTSFDFF